MNPMFDSCYPALKRLFAVLAIAVALAACSRDLSAQSEPRPAPPRTAAILPADSASGAATRVSDPAPPAAVATTPVEGVVRALPDFTQLVEKYGPAVVNVEVIEKTAPGTAPGLSPNDPFYDFFKRFGVPAPGQGPRGNQPPARGAGSKIGR